VFATSLKIDARRKWRSGKSDSLPASAPSGLTFGFFLAKIVRKRKSFSGQTAGQQFARSGRAAGYSLPQTPLIERAQLSFGKQYL